MRANLAAQRAIELDGVGIEIIPVGIRQQNLLEPQAIFGEQQGLQLQLGAFVITVQSPSPDAALALVLAVELPLKGARLGCRLQFGDKDNQHTLALQLMGLRLYRDRLFKLVTAVGLQRVEELVTVVDTAYRKGVVCFIWLVNPEQQIATTKARLIGKGTDRLHDG